MDAGQVFRECWACYRECRAVAQGRIPVVATEGGGGGGGADLWRPQRLPKVLDYAVDFALVGQRALVRRDEKLLFLLRFVELREVRDVRKRLGLGLAGYGCMRRRLEELVGEALEQSGLHPTSRYFREPWEKRC